MATFTGTAADEIITPGFVSGSVTSSPPGSTPGAGADIVNAGAGDDVIDGGAGDDRLNGEAGHDVISGGPGNGILVGGPGADVLTGGPGNDIFVLTNLTDSLVSGPDTIDFVADQDKIEIGHTIAAADFHSVEAAGSGNLAADLSRILGPANLPANGAAEVLINSGIVVNGIALSGVAFGRFAVINDGVAGYNPNSDAVVLVGLGSSGALHNTDFIA